MDSSESSLSDRKEEQQTASLPLPAAFLEFLGENGLDPMLYSMADTIPRYIRLKPGMETQVTEIESELKCDLKKVSWLRDFYAIPPEIQIAGSKSYQQGKIYGIDAASGAAILALDVQPGDHVLDLCAAPGAKLCMLADMLGSTGSLTGVDVAKHRLAACRTMLQKYSLGDRSRLFVADGTSFSILPVNTSLGSMEGSIGIEDNGSIFSEWTSKRSWKDRQKSKKAKAAGSPHPSSTSEPELIYYGKESGLVGLRKCDVLRPLADAAACTSGYDKKHNLKGNMVGSGVLGSCKSGPQFALKSALFTFWKSTEALLYRTLLHAAYFSGRNILLQHIPQLGPSLSLFIWMKCMQVLVDAECTHDGSIKHIQKFEFWGWKTLDRRVLDAERTDNLLHLQLRLLINGFKLLKTGGSLVYSTCSLTVAQNENVVQHFLSKYTSAELQKIDLADNWPCRSGSIQKTVRFDPATSQTSGLFIAKFIKSAS